MVAVDTQTENANLLNMYHDRPSQHEKRVIFAFTSLLIMIFAIYGNTLQVPFHFDDYATIVYNKNLQVTKFSAENIKNTFLHFNSPDRIYRPVSNFSFALNYFLGRKNVTGYHLFNISIHLAASLFLFLFIFNTLQLPALKDKFHPNAYLISLLATFLWASNPVQTQAVTYIVQRMAEMAGMFYIMAMFFYLKIRTSNRIYSKISFFVLCSVSGLLALGSKENAVMLPISLLIYDFILIQGLSKENIKKKLMLIIFFIFIFAGIGLIATSGSPMSLLAPYNIRPFTLAERVLTESRIIIFYISLLIYPMPNRLNLTHDISISSSIFSPITTLASLLLIGSILVVALVIAKKRPLISFCILFFFLNHVVESTILPLELIYEHRNYLPSMLFFVPLAVLFVHSLDYFSHKKTMQIIITAFTILVIVGQGHATYMRNEIWKTQESLWLDSTAKAFKLSRPHMNLGKCYYDKGFIKKAILENHIAIKFNRYLNTDYRVGPHLNLIICYFARQDFDNVIKHCALAQQINPNIKSTYDDMAAALMEKGDLDAAYEIINKSLSINTNNSRSYDILGCILMEQQHVRSAILAFKKALAIAPNAIETMIHLALAHKKQKDYFKSVKYYKMALLKASNPQSFENIYAKLGLIEVYALTGDQTNSKITASNLMRSVNKEKLFDIIDSIYNDEKRHHRSLMNSQILLSQIGRLYLQAGQDMLHKIKTR